MITKKKDKYGVARWYEDDGIQVHPTSRIVPPENWPKSPEQAVADGLYYYEKYCEQCGKTSLHYLRRDLCFTCKYGEECTEEKDKEQKERVQTCQRANPETVRKANVDRGHDQNVRLTPPWVAEGELERIKEFERKKPKDTRLQHLVPKSGHNVGGIHVFDNLGYIRGARGREPMQPANPEIEARYIADGLAIKNEHLHKPHRKSDPDWQPYLEPGMVGARILSPKLQQLHEAFGNNDFPGEAFAELFPDVEDRPRLYACCGFTIDGRFIVMPGQDTKNAEIEDLSEAFDFHIDLIDS